MWMARGPWLGSRPCQKVQKHQQHQKGGNLHAAGPLCGLSGLSGSGLAPDKSCELTCTAATKMPLLPKSPEDPERGNPHDAGPLSGLSGLSGDGLAPDRGQSFMTPEPLSGVSGLSGIGLAPEKSCG